MTIEFTPKVHPRENAKTEVEHRAWNLIDHIQDLLTVTYNSRGVRTEESDNLRAQAVARLSEIILAVDALKR